ncbi:MAG: hypothetical protein IPM77_09145 [Crocinitomicaceae bacterium]|nr:hypothetical protein [Crocinitomicaceae bacterium]
MMVADNFQKPIWLFILVCYFSFWSSATFSKTTVEVEVRVMSEHYKKPIEGAKIDVEENGVKIKTIYTDKRGYAKFSLPTGKLYWLRINSKGLITKIAEINAVSAYPPSLADQTYCLMECELFATKCHEAYSFTESEPMIKFYLDEENQFEYDLVFTKQQLARLKRIEENCDQELEQEMRAESPVIGRIEKAIIGSIVIITGTIQTISESDRPGAPVYNEDFKRWKLKYFKRQVH